MNKSRQKTASKTRVVVFDTGQTPSPQPKIQGNVQEVKGKLSASQDTEDKLMRTAIAGDKQKQGLLVEEAQNRGIGIFSPDLMFEQLVRNYAACEKLYGEKLLHLISGYSGHYLEKNVRFPEFQKILKMQITNTLNTMKNEGVLDGEGMITEKGLSIATLAVILDELHLPHGEGIHTSSRGKKKDTYGERAEEHLFRHGDRYHDINMRKTVSKLIKHNKTSFQNKDFIVNQRIQKGGMSIIYALDSSASMKGKKISVCKRAGTSLAYEALKKKDNIGLIVFGDDVKESVAPTNDFELLVSKMVRMTASSQTNFVIMIDKARELLHPEKCQKHVIILSDALPTAGDNPKESAKKHVAEARAEGITFSLIGIQLDAEGAQLARELVDVGGGRLYSVQNIDDVKTLVLEEYERLSVEN